MTKYTVINGAYIRFWPTLAMSKLSAILLCGIRYYHPFFNHPFGSCCMYAQQSPFIHKLSSCFWVATLLKNVKFPSRCFGPSPLVMPAEPLLFPTQTALLFLLQIALLFSPKIALLSPPQFALLSPTNCSFVPPTNFSFVPPQIALPPPQIALLFPPHKLLFPPPHKLLDCCVVAAQPWSAWACAECRVCSTVSMQPRTTTLCYGLQLWAMPAPGWVRR